MKRLLLLLVVATFVTPALAQVRPAVVHAMDEDVIVGAPLTVPDVRIETTPPKHTHKSLIQVRKSFAPELLASVSKI